MCELHQRVELGVSALEHQGDPPSGCMSFIRGWSWALSSGTSRGTSFWMCELHQGLGLCPPQASLSWTLSFPLPGHGLIWWAHLEAVFYSSHVAWTVHVPFKDWGQAFLAEIWPWSRGGPFSLQRGHSQPRAIMVGLACRSLEALPYEEGRGGEGEEKEDGEEGEMGKEEVAELAVALALTVAVLVVWH